MPQTPFHPLIDTWFRERFGAPTEPQRLGWPEIAAGRHTLIAAPTGSGKTLAAFLVCIDGLLRQAMAGELTDRTQIVYVSPLKALSNDIRRNLQDPLEGIQAAAVQSGHRPPALRVSVRTGDTPARERASMLKHPPHILVTTPESLYLLLTSAGSRKLLTRVHTVIVDEIHSLARDKRGSHLALSLERLESLCPKPPVRIGLSATQKPVEDLAKFLVGSRRSIGSSLECVIIDIGHLRELDLNIDIPQSELSAVCSNEQWEKIYDRLSELVTAHRSTLVFVNTRRMAERVSHRLRERLGETAIASHHGSLSREIRLSAEERLKRGELKAIVATASLELGIDIGFIDLVCQLGSPRSIATFLQRVGRSGHRLGVVPKGRLFVLTRDELLEGLALLRAVRHGRLDRIEMPEAPLDILAQQIVAEVACQDWEEDELFALCRSAWPFRNLARKDFDELVGMLSDGFTHGRKEGAYLHRDVVHHRLRARRRSRLTALTCGGAIPETADYRVVTEDERTFVGTVNEDFAIESLSGDVFLLGNTSWRIRYVRAGEVVVRDAEGAPANVPFWLGEAPGRTVELSEELSALREELAQRLNDDPDAAVEWLRAECGVDEAPARQAATYIAAQVAAVGFVPTQQHILFERFFDESGGMQLVIHAPYGSRINRAWGLALRKRFCRTFDFELQASADDNGIVLSLGPQHSFLIEELFKMLRPDNARDVLIQALLAAPMFQVRWRWNATRALAVLRSRGGKKVPPPLQRFRADDLLTAVFPAQTACFENRPPDLPLPDHPLVIQTVADCLHEAMDVNRWEQLLEAIQRGAVRLVAKDTREPSPFSHSILNANPYAFLDDAPLEERRARAVAARRLVSAEEMRDLSRLDPEAIARVRAEAWPVVRDAEELHDVLLSVTALPEVEGHDWREWLTPLMADGRATVAQRPHGNALWVAAERWPLVKAAFPDAVPSPVVALPDELQKAHEPQDAVVALVRGRMEIAGPVTAQEIAQSLGLTASSVEAALQTLEAEGFALQGRFTDEAMADGAPVEWCERRLLARIHRLTLEGARKRVQPVTPDVYWRFLSEYHYLVAGMHRDGILGLHEAIGQLQGFEIAAGAWETDILPGRVEAYQPAWLDQLAFSGELAWARMRLPFKEDEKGHGRALTRVIPIGLAFRADLPWVHPVPSTGEPLRLRPDAQRVHAALCERGALFFHELQGMTGLLPSRLEDALSELAAMGLVTADGFAAIRGTSQYSRHRARSGRSYFAQSGRWTLFPGHITPAKPEDRLVQWAGQFLRRYGIVCRDVLAREAMAPPWWELVRVFRRLEARGEVRGGRFVSQVAGEQYALPGAVEMLRRSREDEQHYLVISAADPLNLTGILSPGARVPAIRGYRLLLHNGRLLAALQAGEVQFSVEPAHGIKDRIIRALRLQALPVREQILKELSERNVSALLS